MADREVAAKRAEKALEIVLGPRADDGRVAALDEIHLLARDVLALVARVESVERERDAARQALEDELRRRDSERSRRSGGVRAGIAGEDMVFPDGSWTRWPRDPEVKAPADED